MLFNTQTVMFVTALGLLAMALLFGFWPTAANVILIILAILGARWLTVRRHLQAAIGFLLGALVVGTTSEMILGKGLHDISLTLIPLTLILASMLVSRRDYFLLAVSSIAGIELIALAEYRGWLVTEASHLTDASDLLANPIMLSVGAWLVRLLADQILGSLERARQAAARQTVLIEATRGRAEHIEALNRVSSAVASGLDLGQVLETLYRRIGEVIEVDTFYVAFYDEEKGLLTFPIFYELGQLLQTDPNDVKRRPGISGEVLRRKATIYIPDMLAPNVVPTPERVLVGVSPTRSYLGIPLKMHERVIGLMSVQSERVDAYSADQIALLEALATQAAIAIENARLYAQANEALRRERRLNQVMHVSSRSLDWPVVLRSVTVLTAEAFNVEIASLALLSADGSRIVDVYDHNVPGSMSGAILRRGQGLTWQTILQRKPLLLNDYPNAPFSLPALAQAGVRAAVSAPVLVMRAEADEPGLAPLSGEEGRADAPEAEEVCLGALMVMTTDPAHQFDDHDRDLLETIAIQAGAAIQNARLMAAVRQREAILEVAAFAAENFLSLAHWRQGIRTVLMRVGQIMRCSRVGVYENGLNVAGQAVALLHYYWQSDEPLPGGVSPDVQSNLELPLVRPGRERWLRNLSRGEPFAGSRSSLSPQEAAELCSQGVQSTLWAPIYVGEVWWGELHLDDTRSLREWTPVEVDGLKLVAGVLGAAIQRQQADQARRESESLYRRTISAIGAVPYVDDHASGQYTFMGDGIQELTGYPPAEMNAALFNSLVLEAIPMGEAAGLDQAEAIALARQGRLETWRCDYRIQARDGQIRWLSDTAVEMPGPDGVSHSSMGILIDITARREAEEAIRQMNTDLEQRVRERTAELETANHELEAFAYSVAHDLRAPLRSIDGYSKLLQEDYGAGLPPEGRFYLENTRLAAQRMGQLIDDLLRLSRVTRAEMHRGPVPLSQIAADVIAWLRHQEPQRVVEVLIQPDLWVQGDAELIRLALENLLGNAWKFTGRTEAAQIELGALERSGAPIYFVRDNGAGFDMKYTSQLFKAFHRLHTAAEFDGSGVGLATVQRIIHRHGGHIWAKAAINEGATFFFTIKG